MNVKKKFKKAADKVRERYCGGKVCTNCPFKNEKTCLNRLLCETLTLIDDGEKKQEYEQKQR